MKISFLKGNDTQTYLDYNSLKMGSQYNFLLFLEKKSFYIKFLYHRVNGGEVY